MPAPTHTQLDDRLAGALRERGQRVTSQRLVIHRVLRELDRHVTADELLAAVDERLPGVSPPTVYATLDLFEQLGIVRRIAAGAGATRYEPRAEPHHHLVCERCGAVEDLEVPLETGIVLRTARRRGFAATSAELIVRGRCRSCR